MKKNNHHTLLLAVLSFALLQPTMLRAQPADTPAAAQPPTKKKLVVGPVQTSSAVIEKAGKNRHDQELKQLAEALDTTLLDQLNATRKFTLIAGKQALKPILDTQDFARSGRVDEATAAQFGRLQGADYIVLTTITDFAFGAESVSFQGVGIAAQRESARIACGIQIYNTTSGQLLDSATFRGRENITGRQDPSGTGETLTKIGDRLAADMCQRIVDVAYPAKVVAKMGTQVTINRGDRAGVKAGQVWCIYALGEEIKDPDTGESLGRNEAEVGKIRITRLTPQLSYGDLTEDMGVQTGAIARLQQPDEVHSESGKESNKPESSPAARNAKDKNSSDW